MAELDGSEILWKLHPSFREPSKGPSFQASLGGGLVDTVHGKVCAYRDGIRGPRRNAHDTNLPALRHRDDVGDDDFLPQLLPHLGGRSLHHVPAEFLHVFRMPISLKTQTVKYEAFAEGVAPDRSFPGPAVGP